MPSPFDDPILYDWEYRRRRDDVRFYRMLADERGGPILDLGCGTGRLLVPLLRDGHVVVGADLSRPMLRRAAARVARLGGPARRRGLLLRGDLRQLAWAPRFQFAIAAFHTIQHCESHQDLRRVFAGVATALLPGGWLAFDTFAPDSRFLARRAPSGITRFRHPRTARPTTYQERHTVKTNADSRVLAMTFRYQTVDGGGAARGRVRSISLRHLLVQPREIEALLGEAGFALIAKWGSFAGDPLVEGDGAGEQHIYLARFGHLAPTTRRVGSPQQ